MVADGGISQGNSMHPFEHLTAKSSEPRRLVVDAMESLPDPPVGPRHSIPSCTSVAY